MISKVVTMALVGTVLTQVLSGSIAHAQNQVRSEDQAAEVVQELIEKGYLQIDAATGRILMKRSVYDILRHYQQNEPPVLQINGNEAPKTTGKCSSI